MFDDSTKYKITLKFCRSTCRSSFTFLASSAIFHALYNSIILRINIFNKK